ncbi:GntR family transcriptional regulator [Allorhizocola rhizosphaerae]|uniref:GntR family transcriptional regulator n=1 Tax=Allorhizocola rhizosphaerae TaxID=1872709 RepID=UPI001FEBD7D5|nr:GntR family transcriptional regulator [Allorhizocola rhizosphaerae]
MTVQRALRDLQERGLTYAVVGKGTYVHPQAAQRLDIEDSVGQDEALELNPPIGGRDLNRRMAEYILETDRIAAKLIKAFEARDNDAAQRAVEELEAYKKANKRLAADLARHEAGTDQPDRTNPDNGGEAKPVKRTGRTRKTTR